MTFLKFFYNKMLFIFVKCGLKKRDLYVKFTIKTRNESNSKLFDFMWFYVWFSNSFVLRIKNN